MALPRSSFFGGNVLVFTNVTLFYAFCFFALSFELWVLLLSLSLAIFTVERDGERQAKREESMKACKVTFVLLRVYKLTKTSSKRGLTSCRLVPPLTNSCSMLSFCHVEAGHGVHLAARFMSVFCQMHHLSFLIINLERWTVSRCKHATQSISWALAAID